MPKIENVIFDVGRVLYHWDLRHLFEKLIDDTGELDWFLANVVTEKWHFQHDAGRPLAEMRAERVSEFPNHADLIDAYVSRFNETIPGPVDGSLDIVRALHDRDIPLFAITNFGSEFWDGFRPTAPIFDLFGDIVVSGQERLAKPDPKIYALACRRFGIEPKSTIFIDDSAANVDAARRFGLHVHQFVDAPTLRSELGQLGLLE